MLFPRFERTTRRTLSVDEMLPMNDSVETMTLNTLVLPRPQRTRAASKHRSSRPVTPSTTRDTVDSYQSDPQLVAACLDGDQGAWNELVARYQWLIYSVPRRYGLARLDAEDVMQNVFLIVYRRLNTLRDEVRLAAWLVRIAHRETMHYLAKGKNESELGNIPSPDELPAEQIQRLETQHAVQQALARLDPNCRQLLELFLSSETPSYEEIAARLGCPVGSIGPTRARCFKKLEAILCEMQVELVV